MDKPPIFIHSLFRAGSTYLFGTIRQCPDVYCYYESMHELVAWASEDVSRLDIETSDDKMQQLHHPILSEPYFAELKAAWPVWQNGLSPETVYGAYFSADPDAAGQSFYATLCAASPRQPVFSECRTAGRMEALRQSLGGWHAYLWRNPWDQWWSYQIDPYFDAASRVIAHADPLPAPLSALAKALNVAAAPNSSFSEARDFYDLRPLDFETSYAWFYGMWCYLLDLASSSADLLINIDTLSHSERYAEEVSHAFATAGISACDLSTARSPVSHYERAEAAAFTDIERTVEEIFKQSGWDETRWVALQTLRDAHRPKPDATTSVSLPATRHRDALLARRRIEVLRADQWANVNDHQMEALRAADHEMRALHRALEHDRKALQVDREALQANSETLRQERACIEALRDDLAAATLRNDQLVASLSWRITTPLRYFAQAMMGLVAGFVALTRAPHNSAPFLAALVMRSPTLTRGVISALNRSERLRRFTYRVVGKADAGLADTDPQLLSPRGQEIYQLLEQQANPAEPVPAAIEEVVDQS
jgi:hypothetical protein